MLTEDHLIRMINLAIAALMRIAGLRKANQHEDALQLIDITLEQLVGLRSNLIKHMEDERLYFVLTRQEQLDTRRLAIIAELFKEEGDIYAAQNRGEESLADYSRALRYYLEVFYNLPEAERGEFKARIDALLQSLDPRGLGTETLWPAAGYYEENGELRRAEAIYLQIAERPETRESIRPELLAFYQRLLELPAQTLAASGFSLEQARAALERWQREV